MSTVVDGYARSSLAIRFDWGHDGAHRASLFDDVIVVVDVLSFSTATTAAVKNRAIVYPCRTQAEAEIVAQAVGGICAVHRRDVPTKGAYSLSPSTISQAKPGERIAVASPNGATCVAIASGGSNESSVVLIGALNNAQATAKIAAEIAAARNSGITVIACGERWDESGADGTLRFAVEDYLGAGAILSYLPDWLSLSPEAHVCRSAYIGAAKNLSELLHDCDSGKELISRGYTEDIAFAASLNTISAVPILIDRKRLECYG